MTKNNTPTEIQDEALDDVSGGVAMLLPAVQAAAMIKEQPILDFALTGDDNFSKTSAFKKKS